MLRSLGSNLWVYEEPLEFHRFEIGRIMSVMRLSSGGLFVQSPAQLTDDLQAALSELGDVRFVAPASKLHGHLYMDQYRAAFPDVELLATPGLPPKRSDLTFDGLLGSTPDPRWSSDIDQVAIMGGRSITEIAFYHQPSKTVIMGDTGYHISESSPMKTRLIARLGGIYRQVGAPLDYRILLRNESTLRRSIQHVLAWEFDRLIPGHGEIIESNPKNKLKKGYKWLL